jgi:hypothetical protein
MKRRWCLGLPAVVLGAGLGTPARAKPSTAEQARIDKLIDAVAKRTDMVFVRNGKDYSCVQAAEFLRGKLKWRVDKVATVQDFIEQIGTRSTTSGDIYKVRLADGRTLTSADFLRQELRRVESKLPR